MKVWYQLPLWCVTEREEDGTYTATLPDVDDMVATGGTANEAMENLMYRVLFDLRM